MALLGDWVKVNKELPTSQAQIYEGYIVNRLSVCSSRLRAAGVSAKEVMEVSTEVAWFVFSSSSFGLEAPIKVISEHFRSPKVDAILDVLDYARIARVTQGDDKSFAFVHRRFLEYFVTIRFLKNPVEAPVSHIPTDSRGRDALVLYAQLCEEVEAKRVANLCWREIQENFNSVDLRLRAIHCLRFLIDAFCSRRSVILPFEDELSEFVMEHVSKGENLILAKICLEATGLLSESKAAPVLAVAIVGTDGWLQETAFRSCRHLPKMETNLEGSVSNYVLNISDERYWSARKNILLSLSLSDALRSVYTAARIRLANQKISMVALVVALFLTPQLIFASFLYALIFGVSVRLFDLNDSAHTILSRSKVFVKKLKEIMVSDTLSSKGLFDVTVIMFRIFSSSGMILVGVLGVSHGSEKVNKLLCVYSECEEYKVAIGVLFCILGLMLVDWVLLFRAVKGFAVVFEKARYLIVVPVVLGVFALVFLLIHYLIEFLSQYEIAHLIVKVVFGGAAVIVGLLALKRLAILTLRCAKDFFIIRRKKFEGKVTRFEVSEFFLSLLTDYGRLRFVRKLEAGRVSVVGEWPSDFKLSVGLGEPVSALARLEERWLKLDR